MRTLLLLGIVACYLTNLNAGIANGESEFASNFFKAVVEDESNNIVCSPLSAELLLSVAAYGAEGDTLSQLESVLTNNDEDLRERAVEFLNVLDSYKEIELRVASNVFVAEGFSLKSHFKFLIEFLFDSKAKNIDFGNAVEASRTINDWCADRTNNRIKDLVTPEEISKDSSLVFVNAIYFKGAWADPFYPNETQSRAFHVNGTTIEQVPTMHRLGTYAHGKLPEFNASFIEIPYKSQDLLHTVSMYIVLPDEIDGFIELKKNLDEITVEMLRDNEWDSEIELFLPKFKIGSSLDLNGPLVKLGLTDMFSDAANFSGIVESGDVQASKIIQKAFLEVDEAGSEGAEVTEIDFEDKSDEPMPLTKFIVDRPFFSIIATEFGVTLFSALTVDPRSE